jgi:hypothetical protein
MWVLFSPQTKWRNAEDFKIFTNASWNAVFHGLMWFVFSAHIFFSLVVLLLKAGS